MAVLYRICACFAWPKPEKTLGGEGRGSGRGREGRGRVCLYFEVYGQKFFSLPLSGYTLFNLFSLQVQRERGEGETGKERIVSTLAGRLKREFSAESGPEKV